MATVAMKNHTVKSTWALWPQIQHQLILILVMIFITLIPIPFTPTILLPSLILRVIVKLLARLFRPDLSHIFGGKGIMFALESIYTRPKLNIVLHLVLDGPVLVDRFKLQFERKVLNYVDKRDGKRKYEKLRQTWTGFLGFYFWKWDQNFNLDNHIRVYDYTEPELAVPSPCTEDDLKRITGDLIAEPWVEGRSPWEVLILPDYRKKHASGSVAIMRIHHAMVDGYSLLKILLRLFDKVDAKVPKPDFPKLTLMQRLLRPLVLFVKMPYDFAKICVTSWDGPNSWHLLDKKLSRKYHVFFSDDVRVDKIKEIRKKHSVGYNAAVYAVTAGSIRRLMQAVGQKLPKSMSAFVPFPLPNHPGGLAVHVSGMCFKFSPRIASGKERVKEIAANLGALQSAPTVPIIAAWVCDVLGLLPICLVKLTYNKLMVSMGMSSFPGPEEELPFVDGVKATGIIPAIGHQPGFVGAAAVLVSMAGKQRIVLSVDKAIFQSYNVPTDFAQFVNDEVEELLSAKQEAVCIHACRDTECLV